MFRMLWSTGWSWLFVVVIVAGVGMACPAAAEESAAAETTAAAEPPDSLAALRSDTDILWTCVAAFLVFFMQAGFALVEVGFTRAKNACNIIMKNLMDFGIGTIAFYLLGFGLMFGATKGGTFAYIAVTTNMAAAAGTIGGMIASWVLFKKPDVSFALNGGSPGSSRSRPGATGFPCRMQACWASSPARPRPGRRR